MPSQKEMCYILNKELSKIQSSVTHSEMKEAAKMLQCYSGADIKQLCKKANMIPIRKTEHATYFTKTPLVLRCPLMNDCTLWHPCHKKAPGAQELVASSIAIRDICVPVVTWQDLLSVIDQLPQTVDAEALDAFIQFGKVHRMKVKEPHARKPSQRTGIEQHIQRQNRSNDNLSPLHTVLSLM